MTSLFHMPKNSEISTDAIDNDVITLKFEHFHQKAPNFQLFVDETLQNVIFEPLNLSRCLDNMERSIIKFDYANCDLLINKKAPIALDSHSSSQNQLQSHYFCDVMETRHNWPGLGG